MRNFKKNILMLMFMVLCFAFVSSFVYAEEACIKHKNYYLFVHATGNCMYEGDTSCGSRTQLIMENPLGPNNAYFKAPVATDATAVSNVTYKNVTVYKGETAPAGESIQIRTFFEKFRDSMGNRDRNKDSITVDSKTYDSFYTEETSQDGSVVTRYYSHMSYKNSAGYHTGVDISQVTENDLVNASFLPSTTIAHAISNDVLDFTVTRAAISASDRANVFAGVQPVNYLWPTPTDPEYDYVGTGLKVAPAAYYVEYDVCDKPVDGLYIGKIHYLYKDTNKTASPTYTGKYADGEGERVISPPISGCTPDLESVDIKINGANFEKTVYYTCKVDTNPKTGTTLFIVCMIVGFSSLAYFLYYLFIGRKKANNEI